MVKILGGAKTYSGPPTQIFGGGAMAPPGSTTPGNVLSRYLHWCGSEMYCSGIYVGVVVKCTVQVSTLVR